MILDPAETGSWLERMRNNGVDNCREYGRFLGQRYASFDNIVWMHGNDYQDHGPDNDQYTTAVALGSRTSTTATSTPCSSTIRSSGSLDDERWAPLIQLNASYTYAPTYEQVLKDYNRANGVPTFMVEATYEFEHNSTEFPVGTPQVLRRQAYWSNLSGATGQLYGNKYTWQFIDGWKDQLDTPGAVQMAYVTALFEPRKWYELVPDQDHTVVTAGFGNLRLRRLRDGGADAQWGAGDGVCALRPHGDGRPEHTQRACDGAVVRSRRGNVYGHSRVAVRQCRRASLYDAGEQCRRAGERRLGARAGKLRQHRCR